MSTTLEEARVAADTRARERRAVVSAAARRARNVEMDGHDQIRMLVYFVLRQRYTGPHAEAFLRKIDCLAGEEVLTSVDWPPIPRSLAELTPEEFEALLRAVVQRSRKLWNEWFCLEGEAEDGEPLAEVEAKLRCLRAAQLGPSGD